MGEGGGRGQTTADGGEFAEWIAGRKVDDVLPELAAQHGDRYRNIGLRDLGDQMLEYVNNNL